MKNTQNIKNIFAKITQILFVIPQKIAQHLQPLAPLIARLIVGYVFSWSGWGKLNNLSVMIENFKEWGIPQPEILTPFVAGFEFLGGLFLILGFLTRISAGGLAIIMLVAIQSTKWMDVDSLLSLFGFEESTYWAVFIWLAIAGAGRISVDYYIEKIINQKK